MRGDYKLIGYLTMICKGKKPPEPDSMYIDGFTSRSVDGKEISFFWDFIDFSYEYDENDNLVLSCRMKEFSIEPNEYVEEKDVTAKFLSSLQIIEVRTEAVYIDLEAHNYEFELVGLKLADSTGSYEVPKNIIDSFIKKYA